MGTNAELASRSIVSIKSTPCSPSSNTCELEFQTGLFQGLPNQKNVRFGIFD